MFGQPPVPQEKDDFLECRVVRQGVNVISALVLRPRSRSPQVVAPRHGVIIAIGPLFGVLRRRPPPVPAAVGAGARRRADGGRSSAQAP